MLGDLQLGEEDQFKGSQLSKKYGSVFTVWLGPKPVVVISGYQAIKDAFVNHGEEFSGSANYPVIMTGSKGYGVLVSNGKRSKDLRRFSLMTPKNFLMGRRSIEERVQEEAKMLVKAFSEYGDEVIGSRVLTIDDRVKMPYTDAVIHGVQRYMDFTPTSVPHEVIRDTEFHNYLIPEGTMVLPLLSSVLADPRLFKNPDEFDPENFLDENGRFKKNDGFFAFGVGKRVCLGEALARLELFLLFTSLLQRFTFTGTRPPEEINIDPACYSFGRMPPSYDCYIKLRSDHFTLYNISPRIVECFPGKHHEQFKAIDKAKAYIREEVDRRLKNLDTSNPQDYFDVFLVKMLEEKDQPETEFNYDNLFPCVWDLFAAGTETQSSTLSHACLMMIKYPDIQEKVQKEIDEVIGSNRVPTVDDRHMMPYTDAVIHEIQRSMSLAPTAAPHQMTRDTTFHNYHIPKGTTVFPLLSSVLFDPKLFKNPDEFDPENFLDENGRFKENNGRLAFGLGKRSCLGDGMGIPRMVLFLFFISLLQRFTFRGTKPPEEIDASVVSSFIGRLARPYTCYVKLRTPNI
ncbi:unnamed protein product [Coregonus sp. 'balchen']|nr:unnamed protein product [Coregonus sp. 'balchen']